MLRCSAAEDMMAMAFEQHEAARYDAFHEDRDYAAEAQRLRRDFPDAYSVLEIGAGTGRLTRELVSRRFSVTALEPAPEMAACLRQSLHYEVTIGRVRLLEQTIQDLVVPEDRRYDLAVAHYDVLNYVPCRQFPGVIDKLRHCAKAHSVQLWDPRQGVRWLTHKRVGRLHRCRLALRLGCCVFAWFIYWGDGLAVHRHRLYLHTTPTF